MEVMTAMRDPMNRIDRLLWEEANVRDIEKLKSRGSTFAKALWVALLVGMFALLMARPWPPSFYEARVQTSDAKWEAARSAAAAAARSASDPKLRASRASDDSMATPEPGDATETPH
jgi:hypothetical protein